MAARRGARRVRRPPPAGAAIRELGAAIRAARRAAGLSLEALGEPYLTRAGVSRIELGLSAPSYRVLLHFARRLDLHVRELIPPAH